MFGTTRKGLFGAPMAQDVAAQVAAPVAAPVAAVVEPAAAQGYTPPKRSFLDRLDLVADAFSNNNNNAMRLQMQDREAFQNWQATAGQQLQRAQDFADWERKQQYEAAHPTAAKDDAFTSTLRNAGIDPTSPQARALYMQRAQTLASPAPNFVSDGAGGGRWVQPPAPGMGMGGPQAPVGKLTPLGGGGAPSQGARTFPVR